MMEEMCKNLFNRNYREDDKVKDYRFTYFRYVVQSVFFFRKKRHFNLFLNW